MRMEEMERNTKQWEGDAHTIMCAHYWTPLAEAIGETIAEFDAGFGHKPDAEAMCAHLHLRAGVTLLVLVVLARVMASGLSFQLLISESSCHGWVHHRSAVAEMAQEFCTENDLCSREKKKKKKKQKKQKTKSDGKSKPKKGSKAPVEPESVQADVAQKREMIEQARKRGLPPEQLREKVRRVELRLAAGTSYHHRANAILLGVTPADAIR